MLGVIVLTVGRSSETYIAQHIDHLIPGRTAVCSLSRCEDPRWVPAAPVHELYAPKHAPARLLRNIVAMSGGAGLERLDNARLAMWLSANRIKVVLSEFLQVAVTISKVCRHVGVPVVAHAHGYDITAQSRRSGWSERYAQSLPALDDIVVVSEDMKKKVMAFGVAEERVHVVPCGAQVPDARPRARIRGDGGGYKALAIGRLMAKKGPMFLLESFRLLRECIGPVELTVIGDGPFAEPMRQYLAATGLHNYVHLLGALPHREAMRHLGDADIFLHHAVTAENGDEEGLPVSILEAMAAGVPVVATEHAGIPEVVRDGVTGFVVSPGSSRDMATRAADLLLDPALRIRMGTEARALVEREFTIERELHLLRGILSRHWPAFAWN